VRSVPVGDVEVLLCLDDGILRDICKVYRGVICDDRTAGFRILEKREGGFHRRTGSDCDLPVLGFVSIKADSDRVLTWSQ